MAREASFALFPALPAEIRVAIWRLTWQPRVVEVWYDSVRDRCYTSTRPPAVLHVNREARHEALAVYRRAFVTRSCSDRCLYFSPALDVLYLPRHGLMGYDETARDFTIHVRDTAEHVRSLAIDHVRTDTIRPWEPYNKLMLIFSFPNLQETMLVVGAGQDRCLVHRRNSQDSLESADSLASSVSASSSTASSTSRHHSPNTTSGSSKPAVVELVDPAGDDTALIMDAINTVIESFSREIEAVNCPPGDGSGTSMARHYPRIPVLIPKAKSYRRRRRRQKRRLAIGCM